MLPFKLSDKDNAKSGRTMVTLEWCHYAKGLMLGYIQVTPITNGDLPLARKYKYSVWSERPNGLSFIKERCAYEVSASTYSRHQCYRRDGHGPGSLYCKQHAEIIGES